MKTFKEFILEKYYEPDQPLPSGKTPYGKATSSYYRQRGEYFKGTSNAEKFKQIATQGARRQTEVSRGADNPTFNPKFDPSGRYNIDADSNNALRVTDTENNVSMRVRKKDQIAPGNKPVYDVEWVNYDRKYNNNPGVARAVTRNVIDMWRNQVAPRIPSNTVLSNFPITNDTSERNSRSKLYSKYAGFGKTGMQGRQYAAVGRQPSPKQVAGGAQRITPLSGNLNPDYILSRSQDPGTPLHQPKKYWAAVEKASGQRRIIAPAIPSRPLLSKAIKALKSTPVIKAPVIPKPQAGYPLLKAVKALKSTPAIKAPVIPKPLTFKLPNIPPPRIRGGGRAALAAGIITAGLGAYAALNKPKK